MTSLMKRCVRESSCVTADSSHGFLRLHSFSGFVIPFRNLCYNAESPWEVLMDADETIKKVVQELMAPIG